MGHKWQTPEQLKRGKALVNKVEHMAAKGAKVIKDLDRANAPAVPEQTPPCDGGYS